MAIRRSPEDKPVNRSTSAESDGKAEQIELPLRVTLVGPPSGVQFCVQGKTAAVLEQLQVSTGEDLSFDFTIRVAPGESGSPRFLGPYTHGPPSARFVYF
ncbi:MAG: DUF5990 family protein, partial [Verrucomicrobiales bacterium]|nr:DUF5990 family protein [Verrucomicrobiales bacterium]